MKQILIFILIFLNAIIVEGEFLVDLEIIENNLKVYPGGTVMAEMTTFVSDTEDVYEIYAHYFITDENGYVITEGSKTYAVIHESTSILDLKIPLYIEAGTYTFNVVAEYDNVRISDHKNFVVSKRPRFEKPAGNNQLILFSVSALLIILIIALIYQNRKLNKVLRTMKRIELQDLMKKGVRK